MKTMLSSRRVSFSLIIVGSILLCSCAQYTAIHQPAPFTPTATVVGAKRVNVAGELGTPISSEEQNGHLMDTYKYVDGGGKNNGASKTCRVVLYSAGDLFTLFLDQILTWPAETYGFSGTPHLVTVEFVKGDDGYWQVKSVQDVIQTKGGNTNNSNPANTPPTNVQTNNRR